MVFNAVTKYRHCNMPFSNKDKAVIKIFYQFKEYGEIFRHTLQKGKTRHFTKKIWETQSTDQKHEAADRNRRISEENGTTVDELLDPVSQEDQKQTYLSTHQIPKEMVLTLCSIVQIIYCDFCLKCLLRLPM